MQEWHEEDEEEASGADEADPAMEEYLHFLSSLQHVNHASADLATGTRAAAAGSWWVGGWDTQSRG
jgi:hypothetical protein